MDIIKEFIAEGRENRPGTTIAPKFITIHNTSNTGKGADAKAHSRFVRNTGFYMLGAKKNWVSWHFTIDDKVAIQHLPVTEKGFHAGSGNSSSLGIEICMFDTSIEVPIAIRDPDKRIGTHVFTAMARNDTGLRWSAVTIDDADNATAALDRVTIPQEVIDRVGPTALPRSSIVISDEPLSAETNYRTEFVAVLSNQPQGGFITRPRTPPEDVLMAGDGFRSDDGFGFFFQQNRNMQPGYARQRSGGQPYYRQEQRGGWW